MPTNFQQVTAFVKQAAKEVFESDKIAAIIYNTIIDEEYEHKNDILNDLSEMHESNIILTVSHKIKRNKNITIKWNYDSKYNLRKLLQTIYSSNTIDIDIATFNFKELQFIQTFTAQIRIIAKELNESTMKENPINVEKVEQLFDDNIHLNASTICNTTPQQFCAKAKLFGIKQFKSKKLLKKIQAKYRENTLSATASDPREAWKVGSKCKIKSSSIAKHKWCDGVIMDIFDDDLGEWLKVGYTANHIAKHKQIQRYNKDIKPVLPVPVIDEKAEFEEDDLLPALPQITFQNKPKSTHKKTASFSDINNINNQRSKPTYYKQKTAPLPAIDELAGPKQLWTPRRSKSKRLNSLSQTNLPFLRSSSFESNMSPLIEVEWKEGAICQTYIRSKSDWVDARVTRIFHDNNERWLQLRCDDSNNTVLEMPAADVQNIRNPFHEIGGHNRCISTQSMLPNKFDESSMDSLLQTLAQVIDAINHEIDSSHNFLYQVYHLDTKDNYKTNKFISYEHHEAMKCYTQIVEQRYSTSMLCNGCVLKEYGLSDLYNISTAHAQSDYNTIYLSLHSEKLDKEEIVNAWREETAKYNQKWLLSVKREDFVADFIEKFNNDIVQNAIKLYDKLIATLKFGGSELRKEEKDYCNDMMFLWTKKDIQLKADQTQIESLDHIHFLYVVSLILDTLKSEFRDVAIKDILLCLHRIEMNGFLFSKIGRNAFTGSVIIHSHSFKEVKLEALQGLVECTGKLFDEMQNFDLESIQPSSICSVSLSNSETQCHAPDDEEKDDEKKPKMQELDTFTQWMITFDAQYNRGTPFNLKMFKPLTAMYTNTKDVAGDGVKIIINMKYDNYSTDLNEKTYDHVLKSFIAWSITLKCRNLRCEETLKLCCFCDINTFQLYTYNVIMGIIKLKANNDYELLAKLANTELSVDAVSAAFCAVLCAEERQRKYFKAYQLFVNEWINFEFYNFRCEYCQHINKTVMIDRVYQYAKTMDCCRLCNKRQMSRIGNNQPQFDMKVALKHKNRDIAYKPYEADTEFSLYSLNEYLCKCSVDEYHLSAFKKYLKDEEYDSDAVMQDLADKRKKQSNIYKVLSSLSKKTNYYASFRKYLNYDRYPTYKGGALIRYLVLRPKYFSLLKEICLNDIIPLKIEDWQLIILAEVSQQYKKESISSNVTDKRFGIEAGEPIGVHHLVAICLFTDDRFKQYRHDFTKSYWLWSKNIHCNNFYFMGRYIYESVQFYGTKFTKNINKKEHFYLGLKKVVSFDYIAPVFNSPTLTTENLQIARGFAERNGCTLSIRPKYVGDIDNSKILYAFLFNKNIRLVKGTKLQLRSIQTIDPSQDLSAIVLAMQYIEKILLQTEFDVHFYNTDDLYSPINMKKAYLLIMDKIGRNIGKDIGKTLTQYARHLFDNWCFKREFVTFETFRLEMNYMDYKLKEFLFDKNRKKINIINVVKFLPNLKHYHDINGVLRDVNRQIKRETTPNSQNDNRSNVNAVFGLLYNCQSHDIPYHIVNALADIHFEFDKCKGVLREAFRMKLSKLDINIQSFYAKSTYFNEQLMSIGISAVVAAYCINSVKKEPSVNTATKSATFIELILNQLDTQYGNHVHCDLFSLKKAFQKLYSKDLTKFQKAVEKRENVTIQDLYKVAGTIKIFNEEQAKKLSKYLYIKMMDDKEKIVPWECQTCQFLNCALMVNSLWRYYNEGNKCGLCGDPRYVITNNIKGSEKEEVPRLSRRATMAFLKFSGYKSEMMNTQTISNNNDGPSINKTEFGEIDDISKCTLFKSVKHLTTKQLAFLLENHFIVKIIESEGVKAMVKELLIQYKENIIAYFYENKIDGTTFSGMKKMKFIKDLKKWCNNNKLHSTLIQLYNAMKTCDLTAIRNIPIVDNDTDIKEVDYAEFIADCPAMQKVKIILQCFEDMTVDLYLTDDLYPCKMNLFLSLYPRYSPVEFLNDTDHIIKHKLKHQQLCGEGEECVHMQRAFRDRHTKQCKTLPLKKQFFNTNNQIDFVYISMLDRAHCLLKHSDDVITKMNSKKKVDVEKLLKDDATKIKYLPYNTGVYMQYHTLNPLYQNLFDEIIRNRQLEISEDQFNSDLEASKLYLKTESATRRACKTKKEYGIKINEAMHIEHVLCIKFYCNYSKLCERFRRSYRKNHIENTNDDIIRSHCNNHYWFGRFLTTAIEFFGDIPKTSDYFYHGLSDKFVFHHFSTVYEIPTSTTWDITVAHNFCDANGIVIKLSPKYTTAANNSRCLDVSAMSEFKSEKEKLFAGMTVLSITNMYNPSDNGWHGYREYVASLLYFERIIEQTIHQKHLYNYGKLRKTEQRKDLVPLIQHQMQRNGYDANEKKADDTKLPKYICVLFEFFCDNKKHHIDLSCINEEISSMDISLQQILFHDIDWDKNKNLKKYKINNTNLKYIFPNLVEYKNHMGYWIYVQSAL